MRQTARHAGALIGLLAVLLLWAGMLATQAQPAFPALTGRVVDDARLLSAEQAASLTRMLADLETRTTDQLVVVTLASLEGYDIADYGYQLGRHWAIGQKDKNNGVLLIVAPNERKVRIEVGYGLEGTLTDALTRIIIETSILPHFRAGDMAQGILAGSDDIVKVLSGEAQDVAQRVTQAERQAPTLFDTIFWLIFILVIFSMIMNASGGGPSGKRRKGAPWIIVPGGSGSWSGGSGGGGFSGGGGSFGGGGSSGSW